jgi:hypothetical protein
VPLLGRPAQLEAQERFQRAAKQGHTGMRAHYFGPAQQTKAARAGSGELNAWAESHKPEVLTKNLRLYFRLV